MQRWMTCGMSWALLAGLATSGIGEAQESEGFFNSPVDTIDTGLGIRICCQSTSSDELVLYFSHWNDGGPRDNPDIYYIIRESRDEPFVAPAQRLAGLDTSSEEWLGPGGLSADGKEIYFASNRPGGYGSLDVWVARFNEQVDGHGDPGGGFHDIENLGSGVNTGGWESSPTISRDGLRLYFRSNKQLIMASRERTPEGLTEFGNPTILSLRLGGTMYGPAISASELTLLWNDERSGGLGLRDIWWATREAIFDGSGQPVPFERPINLGYPVNTASGESYASLTPDWPKPGSGLYLKRATSIQRMSWHPDCNSNGADDLEDIAQGDSQDIDANGIPDECQNGSGTTVLFRRGDGNDDGIVDISDPVYSLEYQFLGIGEPGCLAALDTNSDGALEVSDPIYNLEHQFLGRPAPPAPYPGCGPESLPAEDALPCETRPGSCP